MFAKAYKTKSHNSLKGSARKALVQKIQSSFRILTEEDLVELVPLKASLTLMKLTSHLSDEVTIHIVDNIPIILEANDKLYPTVYAMWRCPHMLPSLTIYNTVASKFSEGPYNVSRGHIFIPPIGTRLPVFKKGDTISVNMTDNKASILVGIAAYNSGELIQVQRGQCVKTIQMIGDLLCRFEKFTRVDRPRLEAPYLPKSENQPNNDITESLSKMEIDDTVSSNDLISKEKCSNTTENLISNNSELMDATVDSPNATDENGYPIDMDKLLLYCLLSVLKTQGKKIVLPLKTNLLYANHMTAFAPSDRPLDVKKSTYKKMGKFLEAIQKEGLLEVKPIEKGVDAVLKIDFTHSLIKEHTLLVNNSSEPGSKSKNDDGPNYASPGVKEMYKITAAVLPLFAPHNFKRGQAVTPSEVTTCLVGYVRRNELQDPENKNLVKCDPLLAHITPADVRISWEDLKSSIIKKMTHCTEMTFADGSSTINTGKLPMITMQVANRSGNKKVTIVSNLHFYGISLSAMSKECQHGVAASCSITQSPGSKFDQLVVQGNQTYFLAKHLTEFYGLPKRFVEGADKALAKKK